MTQGMFYWSAAVRIAFASVLLAALWLLVSWAIGIG
jgi:hypothetical protein